MNTHAQTECTIVPITYTFNNSITAIKPMARPKLTTVRQLARMPHPMALPPTTCATIAPYWYDNRMPISCVPAYGKELATNALRLQLVDGVTRYAANEVTGRLEATNGGYREIDLKGMLTSEKIQRAHFYGCNKEIKLGRSSTGDEKLATTVRKELLQEIEQMQFEFVPLLTGELLKTWLEDERDYLRAQSLRQYRAMVISYYSLFDEHKAIPRAREEKNTTVQKVYQLVNDMFLPYEFKVSNRKRDYFKVTNSRKVTKDSGLVISSKTLIKHVKQLGVSLAHGLLHEGIFVDGDVTIKITTE